MDPDLLKRREKLAADVAKAKASRYVSLETIAKAEQALAKLDAIIEMQQRHDSKTRNGHDA